MRAALLYGAGVVNLIDRARNQNTEPNCWSGNPEDWHPTTEAERQDVDRARELCAGCPILTECLEYALANRDLSGFWGGTTETERAEMRARQGRKAS